MKIMVLLTFASLSFASVSQAQSAGRRVQYRCSIPSQNRTMEFTNLEPSKKASDESPTSYELKISKRDVVEFKGKAKFTLDYKVKNGDTLEAYETVDGSNPRAWLDVNVLKGQIEVTYPNQDGSGFVQQDYFYCNDPAYGNSLED